MNQYLNKVFDKDGNAIFTIGDETFANKEFFEMYEEVYNDKTIGRTDRYNKLEADLKSEFRLFGVTHDGRILIHYTRKNILGDLHKILVYSPKGKLLDEFRPESNDKTGIIQSIHTASNGKIYIFREGQDWTMEVLSM
jgi:cytochrome oxidase Cu insertion factor (SCO1/SenC/PrrC family)